MKKWWPSLPFMLFFLFIYNAHANDFSSIKHFSNVNKIIQDEQGFIWLAGQQGLTRFDNNEAITFATNNQQWPLPFTWLHDVVPDGENLLVATETNGLWRFNPKTGKATALLTQLKHKSVYNVIIFSGIVYYNTPSSFNSYNPITGVSRLIKDNILIKDIVQTKKYLYASTKMGLFRFNKNKNQLELIFNKPIEAITSLSHHVVFTTATKIISLHDNGKKIAIDYTHKIYKLAKEYSNENFFAINNQGEIEKYSGKTLTQLTHNYLNFPPVHIRGLLHDSSGVLWLVSDKGITQVNENTIKNYPKTFDLAINANEIELFNDQIIIGSYGLGLQNFITPVFTNKVNQLFSQKGLKISDLIVANKELYIATFDGLWHYNVTNKLVEKVNFNDNNKLILKLRTKDNKLYITTNYNGFYIYDLTLKKIINHVSEGLSSNEILDILPLPNSDIWLATTKGVDIYYHASSKIKNIMVPGPNKIVSLILADNKIFASTLGDGIFAFNLQGETLHHFANGIRFSYMITVNDEIWAPARPGLYRFNPKNYQLSMIPNTEMYSFIGSSQIKNDTIYTSHYAGILAVQLKKQKNFNPKVYISKTNVSGADSLLNKSITVDSANNVVALSLASLDYRQGKDKQFKYQINNGLWNNIQGNQLTLTGLASGVYNIEIMATNSLGQWSSNSAYTQIKVAYPWYWTPQIRIVYSVLFISIIAFVTWLLYLRTKSIAHIHQLLTLNIKTRGKTATTVRHNLALVIDKLNQNSAKNTDVIELLQQSIVELNTSSYAIEPDNLNGKPLFIALDFLSNYVQQKYHIILINQLDIEENLINEKLKADIYKIIYEAVMSATLNGNSRSFTLSIKEHKSKLWLTIKTDSDSFIKFNNKVDFDLAMYYIRQIVKQHNASLNTYAQDSEGSQLLISIPLMDKFITPPP